MRFLCLHEYGTSSAILETTLAPNRAHLPANWEFEFLDGLVEALPVFREWFRATILIIVLPARLGVDAIYPGRKFTPYEEEVLV